MNVTQVARIAHEVNRAFCASIGGGAGLAWDKASASDREAAMMSVTALSRGFSTPEHIHEAWVREMSLNGWTHGPVVDVQAKTHPNLTDYAALPRDIQTRDALFVAVVRGALGIVEPEQVEGAVE